MGSWERMDGLIGEDGWDDGERMAGLMGGDGWADGR